MLPGQTTDDANWAVHSETMEWQSVPSVRPGELLLLVGFDGSTPACRAVSWALGQAQRHDARLVIVHARSVPWWIAIGSPELVPLWRATSAELTMAIAGQLNAALRGTDVAWDFMQRDGRPVTQIARVATALGADVVIVGASRRRAAWFCPSIPGRLMGKGNWPVVAVP